MSLDNLVTCGFQGGTRIKEEYLAGRIKGIVKPMDGPLGNPDGVSLDDFNLFSTVPDPPYALA